MAALRLPAAAAVTTGATGLVVAATGNAVEVWPDPDGLSTGLGAAASTDGISTTGEALAGGGGAGTPAASAFGADVFAAELWAAAADFGAPFGRVGCRLAAVEVADGAAGPAAAESVPSVVA